MRKSGIIVAILAVTAVTAMAQTGRDALAKALELYQQESFEKAFAAISEAIPESSKDTALKSAAANTLTDISIREYDAKNWKNAYEGFRKALKYAPTNARASQYYLKIRKERDVTKLANEGAPRPKPDVQPAAGSGTAGTTGTAATGAAGTGAAGTAQPSAESAANLAAYQQALEKLVKTEQDLEQLRQSTTSASNENAVLKVELEKQKQDAQLQLETIRQSALAARDESQNLKAEMSQYRAVIDQLEKRVQQASQSSGKDSQALTEMLDLYRKSMETQQSADREGTRYLSDQLSQQSKLLQLQFQTISSRNMILFAALGLLALLVFFFIFIIVRAQLRRKREGTVRETAVTYGMKAFGAEPAEQERMRLAGGESLLLEHFPETPKSPESEQAAEEAGMYRDLLRAERIRRMHEQVKQGTLKWETVREYIGELEKDLRVEILKVVDNRLQEGDGLDPRAVLAVLSPFLTEHDDYLREKAENLVRESLGGGAYRSRGLLPGPAEQAPPEADDSPLGLGKLMEITENLRKILKDRERSSSTARVARGMARVLGLSSADQELLYKAALAHDAGYLLMDEDQLKRILGKPMLSDEDFEFIRGHPKKGLEYFKGVKLPDGFKDAILSHHERNDGSGYPKGLKGDAIPLFAKIIGVAETYVALTSMRPYREKLSFEAAVAVIRDGIGRRFDREHVDALAEAMRRMGESV
jgi:putative nucleotidyltransferase with HDIG domain